MAQLLHQAEFLQKHYGTTDQWKAFKLRGEGGKDCPERSSTLSLPFALPVNELPAPLPTAEEIARCRKTENDLTQKRNLSRTWVYRVNGVYAVKFAQNRTIVQVGISVLE
jgi:hypothetical protein